MKPKQLFLTVLTGCALLVSSCTTDGPDPAANKRGRIANAIGTEALGILGRAAFATLSQTVENEIGGNNTKIDYAHAIAQNVWQSSVSVISSGTMERIAAAASDNRLPATSEAAAKVYAQLAPQTPAQKQAVVSAIADTISSTALKAKAS